MPQLKSSESSLEVGSRVRFIRMRKRMTLKDLATASGLSESFISQLERGKVSASIASLKRVAAALHISMAEMFDENDGDTPRLVRAADMHGLHIEGFGTKYLLTPTPLANIEAFIGAFTPGGTTGEEPYSHGQSDELFLVLKGEFEVELGGERFLLTDGDCMTYNSSIPHRATNLSATEEGRALWVISPPSY